MPFPLAVQLVTTDDPTIVWLGLEILANAATPVFVLIPLLRVAPKPGMFALVAAFAGVGIDIDHAVSAGSLSVEQMTAIPGRPWTHSLLFGSAFSLVPLLVKQSGWWSVALAAGFSTHLLRDASGGGTPILWPLTEPDGISWLAYPVGILVLFAASWIFARRLKRPGIGHEPVRFDMVRHNEPSST